MHQLARRARCAGRRFSKFGSFVDDAGYAEAIARLDFQLFWFDVKRYRHATSSTFFRPFFWEWCIARRGTFCADIESGLDDLVFDDIADASSLQGRRTV